MLERIKRWARSYPGTAATTIWGLFILVGTIHMWAPVAYAHMRCAAGSGLDCSVSGQIGVTLIPVDKGGSGADMSGTGGANNFVKQLSAGGAFSTGAIAASELPAAIDATKVADGTVEDAEFQRLDGVTSDIQGQIDGKLSLAGGTMTGQLVLDDLMLAFTESDTVQTCGAGDYGIYADLSELKFKKCENGVVTDLDTSGGSVSVPDDVGTTLMDLNADATFVNIASGMLCDTDVECEVQFSVASTLSNLTAKANKDIGGTNNTIELATGPCAAAKTFDCQSGDLCVTVASTGSDSPTAADTDPLGVTAGQCVTAKVTASGDTNADVIYAIAWTKTAS